MKGLLIILILVPVVCSAQSSNYHDYHKSILEAEQHIVAGQFDECIRIYRRLSENYDHVFLRDLKVAAQLSAYTADTTNLFYFLEKGMRKGWTLKSIKKHPQIRKYKDDVRWRKLKDNKEKYKHDFLQNINQPLRKELKEMLAKDQKRALRVALTPVKKWRERYTNRKFVPNNRKQVWRINEIIDQSGFPGEKLIGDRSWATVIISHNEHDTIYSSLKPKLYQALERGELSPNDLAIIETWRIVVDTDRKEKGFAIWEETISKSDALKADSLRQTINLRSIDLNNKLIQKEKELNMKFYLSPFHGGTITVKD